jgi:hypothetical protein
MYHASEHRDFQNSTELGNRILDFLDKGAPSAVFRITKYYCSIAEQHLYRHINVSNQQQTFIRWLFLTLFARITQSAFTCWNPLVNGNRAYYL